MDELFRCAKLSEQIKNVAAMRANSVMDNFIASPVPELIHRYIRRMNANA